MPTLTVLALTNHPPKAGTPTPTQKVKNMEPAESSLLIKRIKTFQEAAGGLHMTGKL